MSVILLTRRECKEWNLVVDSVMFLKGLFVYGGGSGRDRWSGGGEVMGLGLGLEDRVAGWLDDGDGDWGGGLEEWGGGFVGRVRSWCRTDCAWCSVKYPLGFDAQCVNAR